MYERVKVHFSFLCIPYNGVVMHPGVILHSLFQEKSISTPKTGVNRIKISCMTGGKNVTQVYFFFSAGIVVSMSVCVCVRHFLER